MARFFNGKKIELLAPAGNMEIFRSVVNSNCDAIYIGGKSLNMRMMRKGYNFSDEEVKEALDLAHEVQKKLYVTVNNMLNDSEIDEAIEYLTYLNDIAVDGIIVQDLAIIQICKEHNLKNFEIHSSVMMNVHNIEMVEALKDLGVSRVVLSREMDLKTAKHLQNQTGIETEYFMHGDMCTVNGANCYYSSVVLGNSSNRGRCFKPCRWSYKVKKDGNVYATEYPLAAKDMYMYEHIPELIESCITSFKIEGRMRDADFIVNLINIYGEAIDRYIEDPLGFNRKKHAEELFEGRKRDFTTAYAFGRPGLDFINTRYEGTGKFYSTGKVFSSPTEEPKITDKAINEVLSELSSYTSNATSKHKLSVKVNNYEQAKLCLEQGVDRIYLPSEVLCPDEFITLEQLNDLVNKKNNTKIYLDLPQMMNELQFEIIDQYLSNHGHLFDGLLVSNLGAIRKYANKYPLITNYNLNIYNNKSVEFYKNLGVKEFTLSFETKNNEIGRLISSSNDSLELIVHGPMRVMYLDHNVYENIDALEPYDKADNKYVDNNILVLMTDKGENPVYIDQNGKNHLFTSKELCLLPILKDLNFDNPLSLRIEGQTYSISELENIIKIYKQAIEDKSKCDELFLDLKPVRAGFTLGALSFKTII
ncbi:peptidase U32 family protein [Clostridium paridis]|uniref:U32 family peptidase n=1 Tax=Clostridium paridis TaxID=2803863 RepID=A0A937K5V6_9CLOT|nr:U32 family peptidase [Clostridium paridis]MBL4932820.1 U32 family peptidase [Clostridium paridis]